MKEDTNKVKLLSDLCFYHRAVNSDTALQYGKRALTLAQKIRWEKGIAQAYNDIAIVYIDKNLYDEALDQLELSLEIRKKLRDDLGIAALYNKFGIIHQERFQLKEALEYNLLALEIYERFEQKFYITYVVNNLGIIYFNLREYEKALEMHNRALNLRIEIGDNYGIAASHGNIANVYYQSGDTLKAAENWQFAIIKFREMNKPEELAVQLNNLGGLYVTQRQHKKALPLLKEAFVIRSSLNDKKAIASVLVSLGEAQMGLGDFSGASSSLHTSLKYSKAIQTRHEILFAYMKLAKLKALMAQPDSAYFYMENYSLLKDSVFNEDLKSQVAEMRTKYEAEKKEKELFVAQAKNADLELKKKNAELLASYRTKWIWGISLASVAVFFIILYLEQRRRRKLQSIKDNEIIAEREKGIEAVIVATEDERKRIARELHDGIGQQLGGLKMAIQHLENSIPDEKEKISRISKILDETVSEVRGISHQMMPRVLQESGLVPALEDMLNKTFRHSTISHTFEHYGLETRMKESLELSLYRICQELINNIIKHSGATETSVQLFRNKDMVILIVEDNGKGFDHQLQKVGIGLLNISSRLNTLKGEVNYEPSPLSGTIATIRVPFKPAD